MVWALVRGIDDGDEDDEAGGNEDCGLGISGVVRSGQLTTGNDVDDVDAAATRQSSTHFFVDFERITALVLFHGLWRLLNSLERL